MPHEEGNGNSDFAAGVAAATAEQASEAAEEAQETAEQAQSSADAAVDIALDASENAWDAKAEVEGLRGEMRAGFDEIKEMIGGKGNKGEDGPPAPEPKQDQTAPPATQDQPSDQEKPAKKGGQGLGMWRA